MLSTRYSKDRKVSCVRPIAVGVAISVAAIITIICITSLIFSAIESIVDYAIAPITYIALAFGCFAGGFCCSLSVGKRGIFCGAIIGIAVSVIIIIAGCFSADFGFGKMAFIKFAVMVISGCCGGYLGMNRRYGGKRR